jgi:hypothetical protein
MADDSQKAPAITNADATPRVFNQKQFTGSTCRVWKDTVEIDGTIAPINSTIRLARIPSNACVHHIWIKCDALTSIVLDIGLFRTEADGGAVVDADCYTTAYTGAQSAVTTASLNLSFEARDFANAKKFAWQDGGLSSDPGGWLDVVATATIAPTAAGTLTAIVMYADGR